MGDFEHESLRSLKDYLTTLERINAEIISKSLAAKQEDLENIVQAFACAYAVLDSLATPEELSDDYDELTERVHERTREVESIIMSYIESMKLLHDAFFLGLVGRYVTGRMPLRGSIESLIRGLFYYGLLHNEPNKRGSSNKKIKSFYEEVSRLLKKKPDLFPLMLQNHMYEWLKLQESAMHPGLKHMVEQLIHWRIWFKTEVSFDDYWHKIGFKESYGAMSSFVHIAFGTTYTYFETMLDDLETRKFWGAQFSKEILRSHNENILTTIDFIVGLLLNAYPIDLLSLRGSNGLFSAIGFFPIIQDGMPLTRVSIYEILEHKKKSLGLTERPAKSELEDIANVSRQLIENGKFGEAISFLSSVLESNPENPVVLHYLGLAYLESGNPEKSVGYFDSALKAYPRFGSAFYNKACALSRLGNVADAVSSLKDSIEINDEYREMALMDPDFKPLLETNQFNSAVDKEREDSNI